MIFGMVLTQLLGKNVFLELFHSSPNEVGSLADFLSGKEKKKTFQEKPCYIQLKDIFIIKHFLFRLFHYLYFRGILRSLTVKIFHFGVHRGKRSKSVTQELLLHPAPLMICLYLTNLSLSSI